MLTGPYFKPFIGMLNLSQYSFALPFRWNHKAKRLVVTESKLCYRMMVLGGCVSVIYISVLAYQLFTKFSSMPPGVSMILLMWLSINTGVVYSKLFILNRSCEVRDFFNLLISFEEKYFAGENAKERTPDPSVFLVLQLTYVSVASFPIAISSYIALMPCTPPFITSYILQCSDTSEFTGILQGTRFILAISEGMFWFHIVGMAAFLICFLQYLSQKCMRTYLLDLINLVMTRKEICKAPREKLEHLAVLKQTFIFRQIQVLHNELNCLLRTEILPMAQTAWMIITVISLYATIKLHHVIGMPLYLFFPMCAIDGAVFFYVVMGATSQTYTESYTLVHYVWPKQTRYLPKSTAKLLTIFQKSCLEFRTYVGSINFLDKTTPLAIIHFCLVQTGGLILLGNGN